MHNIKLISFIILFVDAKITIFISFRMKSIKFGFTDEELV